MVWLWYDMLLMLLYLDIANVDMSVFLCLLQPVFVKCNAES